MEHIVIWAVVGVGAFFLSRAVERRRAKDRRLAYLSTKYRDDGVASALAAGEIWRGMTEAQLRDSWGAPDAIDDPAGDGDTAATYRYQAGKQRASSRVMLRNGVVADWERM
jgi:hypothetical protein